MITEQALQHFFNKLASISYLVMRNYEDILGDINTGGDIDILISDVDEFISCVDAKPLNNRDKCYNYKVLIGDEWVPVDIRVVGDGYYDEAWEKEMLEGRVRNNESFYVMNEEDFSYSIMYHSLIHKNEIPKKYESVFKGKNITSVKELTRVLCSFMKDKRYGFVIPKDKGVSFNAKNARKLKWMMRLIH